MIAKAGAGSKLIQFDASDAYKQLHVRNQDLNQQIFVAGDSFYVDFCACFGSLYGNDIYSAFGNAHCLCLRQATGEELIEVYVDNYLHVTPFKGPLTESLARIAKAKIERELAASGLKYHLLEGPTTKTTFLGWVIDTINMTISIPKQRMDFTIAYIRLAGER